jgi:hypothetical protein
VNRFNFQRYQDFQKSRKMIIRFAIYIAVFLLLTYLLLEKRSPQNTAIELENIEIDTSSVQL